MARFISLPVGRRLFLFAVVKGERVLFITDSGVEKREATRAFATACTESGKRVLHISPEEGLRLEGVIHRRIGAEELAGELEGVLVEFLTHHQAGATILELNSLPPPLRPHAVQLLERVYSSFPEAAFLTCLDAASADPETLQGFLRLHTLLVVSSEGTKSIASPVVVKGGKRDVEVVSAEVAEGVVKKYLDVLVLSILSQRPMHGYNIIKEIFRRSGVLVSQGMLYPLLHSMERQGLLRPVVERSGRGKVYALTEEGRAEAKAKLREDETTLSYLLSLTGGSSISP